MTKAALEETSFLRGRCLLLELAWLQIQVVLRMGSSRASWEPLVPLCPSGLMAFREPTPLQLGLRAFPSGLVLVVASLEARLLEATRAQEAVEDQQEVQLL